VIILELVSAFACDVVMVWTYIKQTITYISEDACQKIWKRARENFEREKDEVNSHRSSDAAKHSKTWSLCSAMSLFNQFLQSQP